MENEWPQFDADILTRTELDKIDVLRINKYAQPALLTSLWYAPRIIVGSFGNPF